MEVQNKFLGPLALAKMVRMTEIFVSVFVDKTPPTEEEIWLAKQRNQEVPMKFLNLGQKYLNCNHNFWNKSDQHIFSESCQHL